LFGALDFHQPRDRTLPALEGQGLSCHLDVSKRPDRSRGIFWSAIQTAIFAVALLSVTMTFSASPAFAQKKTGGDCKASFMNKCVADCNKRAGRQCDWFCGRRSAYAC
jgi:hypothetical protein